MALSLSSLFMKLGQVCLMRRDKLNQYYAEVIKIDNEEAPVEEVSHYAPGDNPVYQSFGNGR